MLNSPFLTALQDNEISCKESFNQHNKVGSLMTSCSRATLLLFVGNCMHTSAQQTELPASRPRHFRSSRSIAFNTLECTVTAGEVHGQQKEKYSEQMHFIQGP